MNSNTSNLKPFTGTDDPRRQNGRKKGSKNLKSIVRKLVEEKVDLSLPVEEPMKAYLEKNSKTSYWKAIVLAMTIKALNGDVRAATWIADKCDEVPEPGGFFEKSEIIFNVVPDRTDIEKPNLE